jgi:hypothetical protein
MTPCRDENSGDVANQPEAWLHGLQIHRIPADLMLRVDTPQSPRKDRLQDS